MEKDAQKKQLSTYYDVDEIHSRIDIVDFIGRYVEISNEESQKNVIKALCPFHGEQTPSFTIFEESQSYHCFGCGAHGRAVNFLMSIEELDFYTAIKRLAGETGVDKDDVEVVRTPLKREHYLKLGLTPYERIKKVYESDPKRHNEIVMNRIKRLLLLLEGFLAKHKDNPDNIKIGTQLRNEYIYISRFLK